MFGDYLQITLKLTIDGKEHSIPGANVKRVELDLLSYGFSGAVEFVVADDSARGGKETDKLLADFRKPNLCEVAVTMEAFFPNPEKAKSVDPISAKGIAIRRSLEEPRYMDHQDRAILWRRYRVEFADAAQVLWGQHHPCALYTTKSIKDVIEEHKGSKITTKYDGASWTTALPLAFLNLAPEYKSSFYDFIMWFTDRNARVFAYDYAKPGYSFREAKDASGTATQLFGDDVARLEVVFPEIPRHKANVLNSYAEAATTTAIESTNAQDSMRHDFLMRSPIAKNADDRVTRETSRLITRLFELDVTFTRWPSITMHPGRLIAFNGKNLWPSNGLQVGITWRVKTVHVRANARDQGPDADHNFTKTTYDIEVRSEFEQKDEAWVQRPAYARPRWPGLVEGKVVSEQGADDELTYQYYTDKDTSLNDYQVKVPLFADQIVKAPYYPHQGSGKMYMPIYKNARVLLELGFLHATIVHLLDWRDAAMMAMDAQGERIFFGKKITTATLMDHSYDDEKPVFLINRTNDKDNQTITISEGSLVIQVKENS